MKQQQTKNEARYEIAPFVERNYSDGTHKLAYEVRHFVSSYSAPMPLAVVYSKEQADLIIAHHKQGTQIIEG